MSEERPKDENGEPTTTRSEGLDGVGEPGDVSRGPPVGDGGVQPGSLLRTLADQRRRFVLYYLRDRERAELEELTEQVAAWEAGELLEALDERAREDLRIELSHVHLPKLDEVGLVRFDNGQETTYLREMPDPVGAFLDYCATIDLPETTE